MPKIQILPVTIMYQKQQQLTTSNQACRCRQSTAGVLKLTVQCDDALFCGADVTAADTVTMYRKSQYLLVIKGAWFTGTVATASSGDSDAAASLNVCNIPLGPFPLARTQSSGASAREHVAVNMQRKDCHGDGYLSR